MLPKGTPILIVDDQQTMRRTIADILRLFGYTMIIYAEDGIMALERLEQNPSVGLVLLDWSMPRMTGIEVLKKIRKMPEFSDLAVLMITAEGDQEHVIEAIQHGVTDYIVKPFTPITLERKMKEIFPD